jgi:hypothetical protein
MDIVRAAGEALQQALGPDLDRVGRETGAIRRVRKFSGVTLIRTIVLTLLRAPRATPDRYAATAAMLGVAVTPRAVAKRFTPALVAFLRRALEGLVPQALAAAPAAVPLLARFHGVFVGDGSTVALPDAYAGEFPGCGGKAGSGKAAVKLQVLWDLSTGRLARLLLEPGRRHDTNSPALADPPPPGSLTIRDLGYFDLSRFRDWAARGAYWLSRWQPGTVTCDGDGRPFDLLRRLRRQAAGGPFDAPVLLGAAEHLACRLIAVRAPQEVADRRRQKAYQAAQKHGGVPTPGRLAWCDWTVFVTDCPAELLTWKEVIVLYRARWQIELLFKLWKSGNLLAGAAAVDTAECRMAELLARLIGVVLQHWVLLSTAWPEARRSLWKAAVVIRDWVVNLAEAWDDLDRLAAVLRRLRAATEAVAKITTRGKHPSTFQLLLNPELLDW